MENYTVVSSNRLFELEDQVNKMLAKDYVLIGGLSVKAVDDLTFFFQAMAKLVSGIVYA